jgi:phosphatidylglycerophosphate synthase
MKGAVMLKRLATSTGNGLVNNFTFANALTVTGLIADAWNNYMIYDGLRGFPPLLLVWFVALSDLDGYIARWRNAETWLGGVLDPVRDKLFACSKFYFLVGGLWAIKHSYPHLIPLIVVIYFFLALAEVALLIIGAYGLCKGFKVKPNKWGKSKMRWECVLICFILSPLFFLFPQYLPHPFSLAILTILPLICLYLALKSIGGHWSEIELEKSKST